MKPKRKFTPPKTCYRTKPIHRKSFENTPEPSNESEADKLDVLEKLIGSLKKSPKTEEPAEEENK